MQRKIQTKTEAVLALDEWFNRDIKPPLERWIDNWLEGGLAQHEIFATADSILKQYDETSWWDFFWKLWLWLIIPLSKFRTAVAYRHLRVELSALPETSQPVQIRTFLEGAKLSYYRFSKLLKGIREVLRQFIKVDERALIVVGNPAGYRTMGRQAASIEPEHKPLTLSWEAEKLCMELGIDTSQAVTWRVIRNKYVSLARQTHPDSLSTEIPREQRAELFREVDAAYKLLDKLKEDGLLEESPINEPDVVGRGERECMQRIQRCRYEIERDTAKLKKLLAEQERRADEYRRRAEEERREDRCRAEEDRHEEEKAREDIRRRLKVLEETVTEMQKEASDSTKVIPENVDANKPSLLASHARLLSPLADPAMDSVDAAVAAAATATATHPTSPPP